MSTPNVARAKVTLRRYRSSDLGAILALDRLCFAPLFRFSLRAMRHFATAADAITLVAETASRDLAGFVILQLETEDGRRYGYITTIDVAPNFVRSGVATRLLGAVEFHAAGQGARSMRLHVHTGNGGAIQFYLARGYRRVSLATGFYGPGVDAAFYEKVLPLPEEERGSREDFAL